MSASGAPLSIARIGSVMPTLSATSSDPPVSCWVTAAPLCAKFSSRSRPFGGEEALVHGDVDRPQRGLAAERAGDHLVGRLRGGPDQKQGAAKHGPEGIHRHFPERAICLLRSAVALTVADGFQVAATAPRKPYRPELGSW